MARITSAVSVDNQPVNRGIADGAWRSAWGVVIVLSRALALVMREPLPDASAALARLAIGATGYGLSLRLYLLAQRAFGAARTGPNTITIRQSTNMRTRMTTYATITRMTGFRWDRTATRTRTRPAVQP